MKTRIETAQERAGLNGPGCIKTASMKTRIETQTRRGTAEGRSQGIKTASMKTRIETII